MHISAWAHLQLFHILPVVTNSHLCLNTCQLAVQASLSLHLQDLCIQRQQENGAADVLRALDICMRVALCTVQYLQEFYQASIQLLMNVHMCVKAMKVK
jgi:hypothetical protein